MNNGHLNWKLHLFKLLELSTIYKLHNYINPQSILRRYSKIQINKKNY